MPAVRPSAHPTTTSHHGMFHLIPYDPEIELGASPSPRAPPHDVAEVLATSSSSKKRRPPNAFILFRSFIFSNKLYPPEIKHQNDISRRVAEMWRSASAPERSLFFQMAKEEKLRFETEGPGEVVKKKKGVRTRKPRPSKAAELDVRLYVPQSPISESDDSASPSLTSTLSPGSSRANGTFIPLSALSTPTSDSSAPSSSVSASPPVAPQPMHVIPPSLFKWSPETDGYEPGLSGQDYTMPEWGSSSSHVPSLLPAFTHNDPGHLAAFDNALQLELDFLLSSNTDMTFSLDAYPDFLSPSAHAPSLGPLLFPSDA